MNYERQGLERWAAVDLSDFRNSLRRQPDRMTWQRVWLYLLKIDDEESAQLVRDQNPTLSYECEGDAHDDCHYPHCECVHHRAVAADRRKRINAKRRATLARKKFKIVEAA